MNELIMTFELKITGLLRQGKYRHKIFINHTKTANQLMSRSTCINQRIPCLKINWLVQTVFIIRSVCFVLSIPLNFCFVFLFASYSWNDFRIPFGDMKRIAQKATTILVLFMLYLLAMFFWCYQPFQNIAENIFTYQALKISSLAQQT